MLAISCSAALRNHTIVPVSPSCCEAGPRIALTIAESAPATKPGTTICQFAASNFKARANTRPTSGRESQRFTVGGSAPSTSSSLVTVASGNGEPGGSDSPRTLSQTV